MRRARRRALRAAQVVSIGLALAGGGCSGRQDAPPAMDSGTMTVDSGGSDSGSPGDSGGVDSGGGDLDGGGDTDAGMMADAGGGTDAGRLPDAGSRPDGCVPETVDHDCYCDPVRGPGYDADCCTMSGGFWVPGGGCAVPGPFVPPSVRV